MLRLLCSFCVLSDMNIDFLMTSFQGNHWLPPAGEGSTNNPHQIIVHFIIFVEHARKAWPKLSYIVLIVHPREPLVQRAKEMIVCCILIVGYNGEARARH